MLLFLQSLVKTYASDFVSAAKVVGPPNWHKLFRIYALFYALKFVNPREPL